MFVFVKDQFSMGIGHSRFGLYIPSLKIITFPHSECSAALDAEVISFETNTLWI